MRLISHNPRASEGGVRSAADRMERRLDALCARHDQAEARLHRLSRPTFERACRELRRVWHLRDLIRIRLFAVRCGPLPRRSRVYETLHRDWPRLMSASNRLERMME